MKPICVPCGRFFRCMKNDYPFIEGMPALDPPDAATPAEWEPYKLWLGDRWECEGCGASIVVGVAQRPLAEHYEPAFQEAIALYKPELQVNDC